MKKLHHVRPRGSRLGSRKPAPKNNQLCRPIFGDLQFFWLYQNISQTWKSQKIQKFKIILLFFLPSLEKLVMFFHQTPPFSCGHVGRVWFFSRIQRWKPTATRSPHRFCSTTADTGIGARGALLTGRDRWFSTRVESPTWLTWMCKWWWP